MSARVTVLGSANVDLVYRVQRIPSPGETVTADSHSIYPGGKGLNQAVASQRAGAETAFIAAIGDDEHGEMLRTVLREEHIHSDNVRASTAPTGSAVVTIDAEGENNIVILAGANSELRSLTESDADLIRDSAVLVLQLEVPLAAVADAITVARASQTTVLLNPAPVRSLPHEVLDQIDVLIVNEHEAAQLRVHELDVPCLLTTLGGEGATVQITGAPLVRIPARKTQAIDTTGAGDTFVGAFAAEVAAGADYETAARRASIAGSLSVERTGAVPSIPIRQAVDDALAAISQEHS